MSLGEPRNGTPSPAARSRRPAADPKGDREIAIESATHRLGVLTFQRPVPDPTEPIWGIVDDLLAMALLGRNAARRAEAAELQAALFACLSDENRSDRAPPGRARSPTGLPSSPPSTASPGRPTRWPA